jgi:muramoyltetrapeptide carboxypeptidase
MRDVARNYLKPQKLRAGDAVCLVSPASTPDKESVEACQRFLEELGLRVVVGRHALDRYGYLAGRDEDRLADINGAILDPDIRAVIATRGGKGAYRIADQLDFAGLRKDPKLLIGFSEITILHLAIWQQCSIPAIHGAAWLPDPDNPISSQSFQNALFAGDPVVVRSNDNEPTSALTTTGESRGILLGGNLDMIATSAGWSLSDLQGAILLIEDVEKGLGHIDRILTRLVKSGCLNGIRGVAVGQFTGFTPSKGVTVVDVLRDHLSGLGVPILGGLPIGHGQNPVAVPVGTEAYLDADKRTLTVGAV